MRSGVHIGKSRVEVSTGRRSAVRRLTKNALLNRPDVRNDSGTKDTAFRGRRKAKRVRLRKLQRQARRVQQ